MFKKFDFIPFMEYVLSMAWTVEYTDEFEAWWGRLSEEEQEDVSAIVYLLEEKGATLRYPYSTGIQNARHSHLRELRVQSCGAPLRILYAFDPRRVAILLAGGCKKGDDRWYETFIPLADKLYDEHLELLKKENLL